jgi:hypothetical protein
MAAAEVQRILSGGQQPVAAMLLGVQILAKAAASSSFGAVDIQLDLIAPGRIGFQSTGAATQHFLHDDKAQLGVALQPCAVRVIMNLVLKLQHNTT